MMIRKLFDELMEERKPTFTAVVDYNSEWFEVTNTFDEAVTLLRDLVEADHHHVFVNVTEWREQSCGKKASIACHVCWIDTLDGSRYSKTIRVNGIVYGDCAFRYHKDYFQKNI